MRNFNPSIFSSANMLRTYKYIDNQKYDEKKRISQKLFSTSNILYRGIYFQKPILIHQTSYFLWHARYNTAISMNFSWICKYVNRNKIELQIHYIVCIISNNEVWKGYQYINSGLQCFQTYKNSSFLALLYLSRIGNQLMDWLIYHVIVSSLNKNSQFPFPIE